MARQAVRAGDRAPETAGRDLVREFVHRRNPAEVLLADWEHDGEHRLRCRADWPRAHRFYTPSGGRHDALLVVETLRQAGLLAAHVGCGVPVGHSFLMDRLTCAVEDPSGLAGAGGPADVRLVVDITEVRGRRGRVADLRVDVVFRRDGLRFAAGSGWMRCLPPSLYQRVRWSGERAEGGPAVVPPPVDPRVVGRAAVEDVVLGEPDRAGRFPLRVDTAHPVLFDHPLDHVPGMLVFEAMRQAGRVVLGGPDAPVFGCSADFPRFVELDQRCLVEAEVSARPSPSAAQVSVRLVQAGEVRARGTIMLGVR
ncbi:hypothetical protein BJP25_21930 [Actinokineospora bangkokensis]|uniref:A-factor biosynthesis hotdog domain-containing protein n=1 Tax=Actinokineospora bangkokensis TaxID=1193682 RepID=A0A1Q9LL82_9PSEU|nr:hypothetical protein BJP25_21930 [Actinokineospora bangkokensis]